MVLQKLIIKNVILSAIVGALSFFPFWVIKNFALPDNIKLNIWMSLIIFALFFAGLIKSFYAGLKSQKQHAFIVATISMVTYMFLSFIWLFIITLLVF